LLKGVQLIDSLLLGCLQVMDRQSSRIWSGRSWTEKCNGDQFINKGT